LLRIVLTDFLALCMFCFNIHQHGRQILYFKLHVDGCKFHYRRPQVVHRCTTQSIGFVNKAAPPITQVGLGHVIGCLGRRIRSGPKYWLTRLW